MPHMLLACRQHVAPLRTRPQARRLMVESTHVVHIGAAFGSTDKAFRSTKADFGVHTWSQQRANVYTPSFGVRTQGGPVESAKNVVPCKMFAQIKVWREKS